jgi:hypothetical protein
LRGGRIYSVSYPAALKRFQGSRRENRPITSPKAWVIVSRSCAARFRKEALGFEKAVSIEFKPGEQDRRSGEGSKFRLETLNHHNPFGKKAYSKGTGHLHPLWWWPPCSGENTLGPLKDELIRANRRGDDNVT